MNKKLPEVHVIQLHHHGCNGSGSYVRFFSRSKYDTSSRGQPRVARTSVVQLGIITGSKSEITLRIMSFKVFDGARTFNLDSALHPQIIILYFGYSLKCFNSRVLE